MSYQYAFPHNKATLVLLVQLNIYAVTLYVAAYSILFFDVCLHVLCSESVKILFAFYSYLINNCCSFCTVL